MSVPRAKDRSAARKVRTAPIDSVVELEKRLQELELLKNVGDHLTSLLEIDRLLPAIVEQLRAVLGVEIVSIMLLDEEAGLLRIQAASGLPDEIVRSARVPLGEGISGQVALRGEPVLIRDMSQHAEFAPSPHAAQYTTQSLLCVPLRLGRRILGVINVNNKVSGELLDDHDLALVATLSAQAALAIENSRLYGNLQAEVARVTAELRRRNDELRALQEFNESILRNMSSGLVTLDAGGRVTLMNPSARSVLGVPDPVPADETLETLFSPEAARAVLADTRQGQGSPRAEVLAHSRHGREVLLGYSTSELMDARGERIGLIVLFRDLTQVKRLEAELLRMDRMASLGVLGAGIAHEIRNPLAAMRFNLDFLKQDGIEREELDVITKNVERLDDLVKNLLRFARPQQPAFVAQPLSPRVRGVAQLISKQAAAGRVKIVLALDDALPDALIDGPQVEQVVLNVALNGIQAMPQGGTLRLATRLAGSGPERMAELEISDEGIGLDPALAEQVFNPFFTTRQDGTGLGLSVAHRIMEDHGGSITAAPRAQGERGTAFTLRFPLSDSSKGA